MDKVFLELRGKTSILMNNPALTLDTGAKKPPTKVPEKRLSPPEQAEIRRYLLPDGTFYVPATAVRKCILIASSGYTHPDPVTGKKKAVGTKLAGALILSDPTFPLLDLKMKPIKGDNYIVNKERITIGTGPRAASLWRGRPEIWPWKLVANFYWDSRQVALDLLEIIVKDAGVYPALLDYRPGKGGWHGTFELIKIWTE